MRTKAALAAAGSAFLVGCSALGAHLLTNTIGPPFLAKLLFAPAFPAFAIVFFGSGGPHGAPRHLSMVVYTATFIFWWVLLRSVLAFLKRRAQST